MTVEGYFPGPGRRLVGPPAEPTAEAIVRYSLSHHPGYWDYEEAAQALDDLVERADERDVLARRVAVLETVAEALVETEDALGIALAFMPEHARNACREIQGRAIAALSAAGAATDQGDGE